MQEVRHQIKKEMDILSEMFGFPIHSFLYTVRLRMCCAKTSSCRESECIPGRVSPCRKVTDQTPLKVKYMSDANHIWRYGYPDEANITGYDKVQILTHPFAWSKKGYDNRDNYAVLIQEKYNEMIDSINNECKDFCEFKDEFLEASLIPERNR